jgi:SOS-response transcriptional repressor LexA
MQMSSAIAPPVALLMRVIRLRAGMEQSELAQRLRVSQATVSRWERGQLAPSSAQAQAWLDACRAPRELLVAVQAYFDAATAQEHNAAAAQAQAALITLVRGGEQGYDTSVPYFADVAAGVGEAQEQRALPRCYVQVPQALLLRDPGCYALRVVGDSMAPALLAGDIVIVSPAAALMDGCIVAAFIEPDGDVVKTYRELAGGAIELVPANPAYPTLALHNGGGREGRIWGRVVLAQREL